MTRSVQVAREPERERYLPTFLAVLVLAVGGVLMLQALLTFISAVYVFVTGFIEIARALSRTQASFAGLIPFAIITGATLLTAGIGFVQYIIAKRVIQGARWAWWLVLFLTAPTIPITLGVVRTVPREVSAVLPWWWTWVALVPGVFIAGTLMLALLADMWTRRSMARDERRGRQLQGEAG